MKYLFILGRNPELSLSEVRCFFQARDIEIVSELLVRNALLLEVKEAINTSIIDNLGGVISIGRVMSEFSEVSDLDKIEIYDGTKNNISYVVWDFSPKWKDEVSDYLKKRFRNERLKASEKRMREKMDMQNGEKSEIVSGNVDAEYFVFNNYFGRIVMHCDYDSIEKRDMEKPVRRQSLSISPRLAKIMINLSKVKPEETLVDAFCGIGVVLQEALLQNIRVIGIDKDKKAIQGCKQNLKWFNFPLGHYLLLNADSSKVNIEDAEAMVSEPDFGETLTKIPTSDKANEMINRYEKIISSVLLNLKNHVWGRFVFTSPYIRIGKKRISVNFEELGIKTGLNLVEGFPIPEFRENQIVGREIVVFEK